MTTLECPVCSETCNADGWVPTPIHQCGGCDNYKMTDDWSTWKGYAQDQDGKYVTDGGDTNVVKISRSAAETFHEPPCCYEVVRDTDWDPVDGYVCGSCDNWYPTSEWNEAEEQDNDEGEVKPLVSASAKGSHPWYEEDD